MGKDIKADEVVTKAAAVEQAADDGVAADEVVTELAAVELDEYHVTVLKQHVFHDGTNMIVLKPDAENPPVAARFIETFVRDRVIEDPRALPVIDKAP